jgi:hypothetical protein
MELVFFKNPLTGEVGVAPLHGCNFVLTNNFLKKNSMNITHDPVFPYMMIILLSHNKFRKGAEYLLD